MVHINYISLKAQTLLLGVVVPFYQTDTQLYVTNLCDQGIIDMNRNGNSADFFSYVCNSLKH